VLAKLGATVRSAGAVGTERSVTQLLALLARDGVDTLVLLRPRRRADLGQVLPISPGRSRPHSTSSAPRHLRPDDAPGSDRIGHPPALGGPEVMGDEAAAQILSFARRPTAFVTS